MYNLYGDDGPIILVQERFHFVQKNSQPQLYIFHVRWITWRAEFLCVFGEPPGESPIFPFGIDVWTRAEDDEKVIPPTQLDEIQQISFA